ncbi:LytR cell envelope-related transcriptional attenuator [Actinokineospora alba]|uniref:LytR cell envelope-related transcriptional attenuator n=1 Tax=Actinokineospora alba TaxID=504798 RepID=A0A1H0IKB1_9PSEU|nr:LytR cell envelope-related transcriptional attenuator [Actinokineospora alba]SDI90355.1 LytR cell envelope-related transcriptional attenuator [Actinokineospora alba]SDO31842.1 LytR cell envelope-related transcriptional attenuator [Actinokineospora alba]
MAAGNVTRSAPGGRYRKRRPLPALILIVILGVAAGIVWLQVIKADRSTAHEMTCSPPPAVTADGTTPPPLGETLDRAGLDKTHPAPAGTALVRVINASGQNRQAGAVTETLRELGFTQIADPANDLVYPRGSLDCRAQIRFGQQGMSVARTLNILEPCAELVRDERQDATVDFAIGQKFDHLKPSPEARKVVETLAEWAASNPDAQGGLLADGSSAAPIPQDLIDGALDQRC